MLRCMKDSKSQILPKKQARTAANIGHQQIAGNPVKSAILKQLSRQEAVLTPRYLR